MREGDVLKETGGDMIARARQAWSVGRRDLRLIYRSWRHDWLARDEERARQAALKRAYEASGRTGPPPHIIKQEAVRQAARAGRIRTLVETGTLHGDMVAAMSSDFDDIYSIELSLELYLLARLRFLGRRHVHLIRGDSSDQLGLLLQRVNDRCVFWLDGHYGGGIMARGKKDVPIVEEINAILAHPVHGHVILIDDLGIFERAQDGTPSTAALEELVRDKDPSCSFVTEDNMIRITLSSDDSGQHSDQR